MLSHDQAGKLPYAAFGAVVVGASAGGIQALLPLLEHLPANLSSPVVIALHLPPASQYVSTLPTVLQRRTALKVKWAEDQESILPGVVYVAPQDCVTEINTGGGCPRASLTAKGGRTMHPADLLFRSAAQVFGRRTLAVVLSGVLNDGAAGSAAIARAGGLVLVQIASEAQFDDMPRAAMRSSHAELAFDSISLAHVIADCVMVPGARHASTLQGRYARHSDRPAAMPQKEVLR